VSGNPTISATSSVPTTFTADSGTATPSSNNLNVLGTSAQGVSSSGSGDTLTFTVANASDVQKGVASFNATNFTATSGAITSNAMTVTAGTGLTGGGSLNLGGSVSVGLSTPVSVSNGGTGATSLTQNGVVYGNGTSAAGVTTAGTNGQVLLGATSAAPAFGTLTGSNGITYSTGANSLQISNSNIPNAALANSSITVANGTGISVSGSPVSLGGTVTISASASTPTTFNADTGSATPSANTLTVAGTSAQGISTSATGATVTVTASDASTSQKGVVALATNAETIAGTDTAKAVTADDLKAKLGTQTSNGLPYGAGTSSAISWTAAPTNGQLLIGSTGTNPALGTITQPAAGLTVTNGAGSITLALANDLAAVEGLSTTGLAVRTGTDTWTTRTLAAGSGISISNADGISGNPTISSSTPSVVTSARTTLSFVDDFIGLGFSITGSAHMVGDTMWDAEDSTGTVNSSLNVPSYVDAAHPGIVTMATGSSSTGVAYISKRTSTVAGNVILGAGQVTTEFVIRMSALSDSSQRFTIRCGLSSSNTTEPGNGVYFEYSDNINSGNWVGKTASSSSRTSANSAVAASTDWVRLTIVVNAAATSASFYINGTEIANSPISTNIPTAVVCPFAQIIKSVGSSSRSFAVDYCAMQIDLTNSR
jgi:hypothetical protein